MAYMRGLDGIYTRNTGNDEEPQFGRNSRNGGMSAWRKLMGFKRNVGIFGWFQVACQRTGFDSTLFFDRAAESLDTYLSRVGRLFDVLSDSSVQSGTFLCRMLIRPSAKLPSLTLISQMQMQVSVLNMGVTQNGPRLPQGFIRCPLCDRRWGGPAVFSATSSS